VTVKCPVCCLASVRVIIDPGEPQVRYYADGSGYPGSPPAVDDWDADCSCGESPLVDWDRYRLALEDAVFTTEER
jgi:hypothetical protein